MAQSASRAIDVHTFWPVIDQPPSTRSARVDSEARSLPAPGSENIWHQLTSPRSEGPMKRSCCSGLPCATRVGKTQPAIARCARRTRAARSSRSITSCSTGEASRPQGRGQWGAR